MNKYDSERINGVLISSGMEPTGDPGKADVILLNTCSIREKAEHKVFSMLGRLSRYKNGNKGLLIAVGGCVATLRKADIFKQAPIVDLLFGPDSLERLPGLIGDCLVTGKRGIDLEFDGEAAWDMPESNVRQSSVSAWLGIMKGCDNHCTYCVVPSTRGPEVSRPPGSIVGEVENLVRLGYREVNLLGQNVNSYGKGLKPEINFPGLLRLVDGVEGIERIRFITSHPKDLNDDLIEAVASSKNICPSIHLPLQAGSDRILELMNRRYSADEYIGKVKRIKKAIPGVTISTDIMVGFPTETEEDFMDTIGVMEEVRFDSMYLFNYSPRPGTHAAEKTDRVGREESKSRFRRALELNKKIIAGKNRAMVGTEVELLCEGEYIPAGNGNRPESPVRCWHGRTPGNHLVMFNSKKDNTGMTIPLTITSFLGYNLRGESLLE